MNLAELVLLSLLAHHLRASLLAASRGAGIGGMMMRHQILRSALQPLSGDLYSGDVNGFLQRVLLGGRDHITHRGETLG